MPAAVGDCGPAPQRVNRTTLMAEDARFLANTREFTGGYPGPERVTHA